MSKRNLTADIPPCGAAVLAANAGDAVQDYLPQIPPQISFRFSPKLGNGRSEIEQDILNQIRRRDFSPKAVPHLLGCDSQQVVAVEVAEPAERIAIAGLCPRN
jgi:hypothetical protein